MTIKEIAKLCGVSRGTVDRVLNKRGRVKPETEQLIMSTMEEMGYTKNIVGRALTVRKTAPCIGVVLCSDGNPFFDDVILGLKKAEQEGIDYGVTMLLRTRKGHKVATQLALLEELIPQISVLVIQPINDPRIEQKLLDIEKQDIPVITINTDINSACRCCYVGSDYECGGKTAAGLMALITGGEAKLGIINGVQELMGHTLRLRGFENHLKQVAPHIAFVDCQAAKDDPIHAYEVTKQMLTAHQDMDALFVVAAGAYDVCRAIQDLQRHETVGVIAFDDVPKTREMMQAGIIKAVVCQQPYLQGYRAFKVAFDIILTDEELGQPMVIMENQIKIRENLA